MATTTERLLCKLDESWRAVAGGHYEVSSAGRVRRALGRTRGQVLAQAVATGGRRRVCLCVGNRKRMVLVHVLVAEAFLGPRPPGHEIDHVDGDHTNNRADNLEYVTPRENERRAQALGLKAAGERHGCAKLTREDVAKIHELRRQGLTQRAISERFCVTRAMVALILTGRNWRGVTA